MSFDPSKLLIVFVVALIVLGPEKLPHFMRQAGKYLNEFRSMRDRLKSEVDNALGGITGATSGITNQITQQIDPIKDVLGQFKGQASNPFSIGGAVGSIFGTQTASNQVPNNSLTGQNESTSSGHTSEALPNTFYQAQRQIAEQRAASVNSNDFVRRWWEVSGEESFWDGNPVLN